MTAAGHLHTFVIPAYGFSPHLSECVASLQSQTSKSCIIVSTSTPCSDVAEVCRAFDVELRPHSPNRGIGHDWNQALSAASTPLVTLAHQDDVYYRDFAGETISSMRRYGEVAIAFTDYDEITADGKRPPNRLLRIKQTLLHAAFLGRVAVRDRLSKRNAIRFACPIPCPSVTINTAVYGKGFNDAYQINLDWASWLQAADSTGAFVWIRKTLMGHRIHESSETSAAILDGRRAQEDYAILQQLWPAPVARMIAGSYGLAYRSNEEHVG